MAAESRTERVSTCSPPIRSSGPRKPVRGGFSPWWVLDRICHSRRRVCGWNRRRRSRGPREPMRAATAAADPPLEPPGVDSDSRDFSSARTRPDSVVGRSPNSGVFVFPTMMRSAPFVPAYEFAVRLGNIPLLHDILHAKRRRHPGTRQRGLSAKKVHRQKGPSFQAFWPTFAPIHAPHRTSWVMTALSFGLIFSIRVMVNSISSSGLIFFFSDQLGQGCGVQKGQLIVSLQCGFSFPYRTIWAVSRRVRSC